MAHTTNRAAFRSGTPTSPFLRLYTLLTGVEIALKDHRDWSGGHDLRVLAVRALDPLPAGVTAQLTVLERCLSALTCTARDGSAAPIDPSRYPGLRYLRHDTDFPGTTSVDQLATALIAAQHLADELVRAGVAL